MTIKACRLATLIVALIWYFAGLAHAATPSIAIVGDINSESAAKLQPINATDPARDENGQPFRRLNPSGRFTFELACEPARPNYLTVRLSGSEANENYLYVVQPDGATDIFKPEPEHRWGDLDHNSDNPPFDERYYYSTYGLPFLLTKGKTVVRLTIESRGSSDYYGGHVQHEQKTPGKAIYLIAVHAGPFFIAAGDDASGQCCARCCQKVARKLPGSLCNRCASLRFSF